jgi:hypothetical protein
MKHKNQPKVTENDVIATVANPIYAITIHPDLFGEVTQPLVAKDRWVQANARLIEQMGPEQYLRRLLAVLEGDFPRNPDPDDHD